MISIASMSTPAKAKPAKSKESLSITAGIASSGMSKAAIAKRLGVDASFVSHWATGHRPVPAAYARPLGELIGLPPEAVSLAFAEIGDGRPMPTANSDPTQRYAPVISAMQDDIRAINLALGILVATMARHRPAEARAAAAAMRKGIPKSIRDYGLVHELLKSIE